MAEASQVKSPGRAMNPSQQPSSINGMSWSDLTASELNRVSTFASYPLMALASPCLLAHNGFAYIGTGRDNDDTVICVFCHSIHRGWLRTDDIAAIHRYLSPSCPFVKGTGDEYRDAAHDYQEPSLPASPTIGLPMSLESIISNDPDIETDSTVFVEPSQESDTPFLMRQYEMAMVPSDNPDGILPPYPSAPTSQPSSTSYSPSQPSAATLPSETPNVPPVEEPPRDSTVSQPEELPPAATPTTPEAPSDSNSNTSPSSTSSQNEVNNNSSSGSAVTNYSPTQLSIEIARPKRPEYSRKEARRQSFEGWPSDHHIHVEDLVDAGFFYAGYSDCARCFFCGGGLRNWEPEDNVYVEHVRWFPNCAFVRMTFKPKFVAQVKYMHDNGFDYIMLTDVLDRIGMKGKEFIQESEANLLEKDPGVRALIEFGFDKKDVLHAAQNLNEESTVCAEFLLRKLLDDNNVRKPQRVLNSSASRIQPTKELISKQNRVNGERRRDVTCKVCLNNPVSVLFLPCGHLASCSDCSICFDDCPVCRKHIGGRVRVATS